MTPKKQLRWLHKKPGEMLGAETRSVSIRKVRESQKLGLRRERKESEWNRDFNRLEMCRVF